MIENKPEDQEIPNGAMNTSPGRWLTSGDGVNRAKIRKEMASVPRAFRLKKRAQMQHRQDIAHLMQHPAAGESGEAARKVRNALKALRRARRAS